MDYTSIYKQTKEIFTILPERYQRVLCLRFGIDEKPHTLEGIGKRYGITRERVRQIIVKGFSDILHAQTKERLAPLVGWVEEKMAQEGMVVPEDWFLEKYGKDKKGGLFFVLHIGERFHHRAGDARFTHRWYMDEAVHQKALQELVTLEGHLEKKKEMIPEKEVLAFLSHPHFIRISKKVLKSVLGHYGLSHWPEVLPRGIKDKAYVVLLAKKKPLHFSDIASGINEFVPGRRKALKQTVHNELIKDPRFVLVGRGTYALRTWGYKEGTVADILYALLRETKRPLEKKEVIDLVLGERMVKPNTVILNLNEHEGIVRLPDGRYTVRG
ncbi:MAG: hypothetical protein HYZ69_00550 [Candidatus Colwellbacteria bacterium]|nr:hypothetical protein [Candidatus Colwellbacteria bacterium]